MDRGCPLPCVVEAPDRPDWFVLSTYKNNFDLMELFVSFYRRAWGISKFYFLIGRTDRTTQELFDRIAALNSVGEVSIEYITFDTRDVVSLDEWGAQRDHYFAEFDARIPESFTHVLNIDNDEFLYVANPEQVDRNESLHFHFVELVPHSVFSWDAPLTWSLQGWFYRVNFFRRGDPAHLPMIIKPAELGQLRKDLGGPQGALGALQLTHQWCKLIRFLRSDLRDPWAHLDGAPVCMRMREVRRPEEALQLLYGSYFCYHLGILDARHLEEAKPKWTNSETGRVKTQSGDIVSSIGEHFREYYAATEVFAFEDDYLKTFLPAAGMERDR